MHAAAPATWTATRAAGTPVRLLRGADGGLRADQRQQDAEADQDRPGTPTASRPQPRPTSRAP